MYDNLMTYANYARWKNRNQQTVRDWVAAGKVKSVNIDGRLFVVLTDEEVKQRESLFSQHPTKGLHRIGDVMSAMFNGKMEEQK